MTIRKTSILLPLALAAFLSSGPADAKAGDKEGPKLKRVCASRVETGSLIRGRKCRMVPEGEVQAAAGGGATPDRIEQGSSPQTNDLQILSDGVALER